MCRRESLQGFFCRTVFPAESLLRNTPNSVDQCRHIASHGTHTEILRPLVNRVQSK